MIMIVKSNSVGEAGKNVVKMNNSINSSKKDPLMIIVHEIMQGVGC